MARLWRRLLRHTAERESGLAMAAVRIAMALATLILLLPFVCTEAGHQLVRFSFVDIGDGGYRHLRGSDLLHVLGGPTWDTVFPLLVIATVAAVLMLLGLFGRLPVIVCAVCTRLVFGINSDVSGGGDALMGNAFFILAFADSTARWSLDAFFRKRGLAGQADSLTEASPDTETIAAWPRKLMVALLVIVYTTTGLQKLVSTAWTPLDGASALYQILQSPQWARFPEFVPEHGGLLVWPLAFMSLVTIVWEVGFCAVLWGPRLRALVAVVGVGIHIGILVTMEVGVFSWMSLALYPALWRHGSQTPTENAPMATHHFEKDGDLDVSQT